MISALFPRKYTGSPVGGANEVANDRGGVLVAGIKRWQDSRGDDWEE